MLLNNEWVNNEIKEEIKRYFETNENWERTIQNLCNTGKAIVKGNSQHYRPIAKKENKKEKRKKLK